MRPMDEIKILCDTPAEVQKMLNQWRHQFELNIISTHPMMFMNNGSSREVHICVTVERRMK